MHCWTAHLWDCTEDLEVPYADPSLSGYEYQGRVQFREGGPMARPHLQAESMQQLQEEAAASLSGMVHYTTLITADGHQYRKRYGSLHVPVECPSLSALSRTCRSLLDVHLHFMQSTSSAIH